MPKDEARASRVALSWIGAACVSFVVSAGTMGFLGDLVKIRRERPRPEAMLNVEPTVSGPPARPVDRPIVDDLVRVQHESVPEPALALPEVPGPEALEAIVRSAPPEPLQLAPRPVPSPPEPSPGPLVEEQEGRITLRADDEETRQVLGLLSRESGINILVSPGVSGSIRLDLQDVTFEQALEAITKLADLGVREANGLYYVYTAEEMRAQEAQKREPMVRVYHLNYIRANDLAVMLQPFLSEVGSLTMTPPASQGLAGSGGAAGLGGGGAGTAGSMLAASASGTAANATVGGAGAITAGGSVAQATDTGGNSLATHDVVVARDLPENLAVIDQVVRRLDVQPPQVLIEAVILNVQLSDDQSLGVNFSVVDNLDRIAGVSGLGNRINGAGGFSPARVLSAAGPPEGYIGDRPSQLIPGYLGPNSGLKFGFISNNVAGFIEAIERFGKTNVLASPRIMVLNKQRAEIQLGQRLGFRNTVTNLTSSLETVEFLSVGTLLSFRPFVSSDGMVRLEVHPEKSSGFIDSAGVPQTNTSEVTTNILVPDGATVVIGGLIDDQDEIVEEGVPGLMRIPVLGAAFRTRNTRTRKTELIVLLTPRIIHRGGLPEPDAGLPPRGEMGIPNSGPMPGPSASLVPTPGLEFGAIPPEAIAPGETFVMPGPVELPANPGLPTERELPPLPEGESPFASPPVPAPPDPEPVPLEVPMPRPFSGDRNASMPARDGGFTRTGGQETAVDGRPIGAEREETPEANDREDSGRVRRLFDRFRWQETGSRVVPHAEPAPTSKPTNSGGPSRWFRPGMGGDEPGRSKAGQTGRTGSERARYGTRTSSMSPALGERSLGSMAPRDSMEVRLQPGRP